MKAKILWLPLILTVLFALVLFAAAQAKEVKSNVAKGYKLTKCGTVVHVKSGLEWAPDPGNSMSWAKARKYVGKLDLCGHKDWKMPKITEIRQIYDEGITTDCKGKACHKGESFHIHKGLKLGQCCPWTCSKDSDGNVQCLNFSTGNEGGMMENSPQRVLAVRKYKGK